MLLVLIVIRSLSYRLSFRFFSLPFFSLYTRREATECMGVSILFLPSQGHRMVDCRFKDGLIGAEFKAFLNPVILYHVEFLC